MAISPQAVRIFAALLVAAGCIVSAFLLSGRAGISTAEAEGAQELLRAYAAKDTDADGLPDWKEDLYGSDPANARSIDPSMTDQQAVEAGLVTPRIVSEAPSEDVIGKGAPGIAAAPETLTDRFAREFFGKFLSQSANADPSTEDLEVFVADAVANLSVESSYRFASSALTSVPSSPEAFRLYAQSAGAVLAANTVTTQKSELEYFSNAVMQDDRAALAVVARVGASYERAATAMMGVAVPESAAAAHLRLANALSLMGTAISSMGEFATDPLKGFVGLTAYEPAVIELVESLKGVKAAYTTAGVVLTPGEVGYDFYATLLMSSGE